MTGAPGIAPPFSLPDVPVAIIADADVVARLEQERSSRHDADLQSTVRRRLEAAGRLLAHLERRDLTWPPPRRIRRTLNATISRAAWDELRAQAAMGARFMDHQIVIGFMVGAVLVYLGDRIIRYIPDPDQPVDK